MSQKPALSRRASCFEAESAAVARRLGTAMAMTLDVDVVCDESCFDLPEWRELLARDPDSHVFASPEWN